MAKKRPPAKRQLEIPDPEHLPDHMAGPWVALHDASLDPPWGIFGSPHPDVMGLVAAVYSSGPEAAERDARRIVAAVNAVEGIPSESLDRNVLGKLSILVSEMADLLEGKQAPVNDHDAYRAHVIQQARALLASLNEKREPRCSAEVSDCAPT